jgi:hypothetical protein
MDKKEYAKLLLDPRWQKKKSDIQNRDDFECKKCGCRTKTLHVHHKHYIFGRMPWDYPDQLLVLLCIDCHKEEEDCKDVIAEFTKTLLYWGYFNTDIRDLANELITKKLQSVKSKNEKLNAEQNIA